MKRYSVLIGVLMFAFSAFSQKPVLPHADFVTVRNGLPHFTQSVLNNRKATIAFVGGSITFNPGWRDKISLYLQQKYPAVQFHFATVAIPSLGSVAHVFRLQNDLLDSVRPDLVFVESAVNDRGNGTDSITQIRALDGIVRQIKKANALTDIVLLALADPDKTNDYNQQKIPVEVSNHEAVAAHYHLPSANIAKEVRDRINNHEISWEKDFTDIHPAENGQQLYFKTVAYLLDDCLAMNYPLNKRMPKLPVAMNKASFVKGRYYSLNNAVLDAGWHLDKGWTPTDGLSTRDGFVHVPMLIATEPGAQLVLPFNGNAVGIGVVAGGDAGIISYSIDGAAFKDIDLYTVHSSWLHLPSYMLLGSNLKNGNHKLVIKIADNKNNNSKGYACRIVHFLLNG